MVASLLCNLMGLLHKKWRDTADFHKGWNHHSSLHLGIYSRTTSNTRPIRLAGFIETHVRPKLPRLMGSFESLRLRLIWLALRTTEKDSCFEIWSLVKMMIKSNYIGWANINYFVATFPADLSEPPSYNPPQKRNKHYELWRTPAFISRFFQSNLVKCELTTKRVHASSRSANRNDETGVIQQFRKNSKFG